MQQIRGQSRLGQRTLLCVSKIPARVRRRTMFTIPRNSGTLASQAWAFLFVLLLLPLSSAQPATLVVDDPQGDTVAGGAATAQAAYVDLVQIRLFEDVVKDAIAFEFVTAGPLPPVTGAGDPIIEYDAEFRFGQEWRRVRITVTAGDTTWEARWSYEDIEAPGTRIFQEVAVGDATFTLDGVQATLPRLVISDVVRVEPRTIIDELVFHSRQFTTGLQGAGQFFPVGEVKDRAPDAGALTHELTFHIEYTDDLLVYSPTMVKASNGGATTLVFPAQIRGVGPVDVAVAGVPADWAVRVPVERIEAADINMTIPIILTAIFKHQHGVSQTFEVAATNERGTARAFFGIHYLEFPQPAGHHSRLWIHAVPSGQALLNPVTEASGNDVSHRAVMTARDDFPGAEDEPVAAGMGHFPGVDEQASWQWRIPLSPELALGLHPSEGGTGMLEARFTRGLGAEVNISAVVQIENPSTNVSLPLFASEQHPASVGASPTSLRIPIQSLTQGPIPFVEGSNLWLIIQAQGLATGIGAGPESSFYLQPGATLDLALDEYRDPITGVLPASSLAFRPDYVETTVRPASTTLHEIMLRNQGTDTIRTRMTVQASGADVGVDETAFLLGAGGDVRRDLTVTMTADTAIISVAAVGEDGSIALMNIVLEADEAAAAGRVPDIPVKRSPLAASPMVIITLLAIAGLLRTRKF